MSERIAAGSLATLCVVIGLAAAGCGSGSEESTSTYASPPTYPEITYTNADGSPPVCADLSTGQRVCNTDDVIVEMTKAVLNNQYTTGDVFQTVQNDCVEVGNTMQQCIGDAGAVLRMVTRNMLQGVPQLATR